MKLERNDWEKALSMEKDKRGWQKTRRIAFRDVPSSIVEPIINSADSYEEKFEKYDSKDRPIAEIIIDYAVYDKGRKKGMCIITDFAMGIPGNEIMEKFRKHEKSTSARMERGCKKGGGWKGVGVKDTLMFHSQDEVSEITSFFKHKDGITRYSQVLFRFNDKIDDAPKLLLKVQDEKTTKEILEEYGMKGHESGTVIKIFLGLFAKKIDFDEFKDKITRHFRLRKLMISPYYNIILIDHRNLEKKSILKYKNPEIDKVLYSDEIIIKLSEKIIEDFQERLFGLRENSPEKFNKIIKDKDMLLLEKGEFKIKLEINKSKDFLKKEKPYRENGILVYHDDYSILDCTLFGWEDHHIKLCDYLFGEAEILNGSNILLALEETGLEIVDQKRKQLEWNHPFVKIVTEKISEIIEKLIEENEIGTDKKSIGSEQELRKALREINKDLKNELDPESVGMNRIEIPEEGLKFFPTRSTMTTEGSIIKLKQLERKGIWLAINKDKVKNTDKIKFKYNEECLSIDTKSVHHPDENRPNLEVWTVNIFGEEICSDEELKAYYENYSDIVKINVVENEKLYPHNGFEFIPNEKNISIDTKIEDINYVPKGNVFLIFDKNIISDINKVKIEIKNDINEIVSIEINKERIKKLNENISFIKIPVSIKYEKELEVPYSVFIYAKSGLIIGHKTFVKVNFKKKGERAPLGLISNIEFDDNKSGYEDTRIEPKTIDGKKRNILFIHTWHPTFTEDPEIDTDVLEANAASRCLVKKMVELKGTFDPEDSQEAIREFFSDFYLNYDKYGKKWQDAILRVLKSRKGDE